MTQNWPADSQGVRDALALYVTGLDGRNLRPVLGPPLRYRSHAAFGPSRNPFKDQFTVRVTVTGDGSAPSSYGA